MVVKLSIGIGLHKQRIQASVDTTFNFRNPRVRLGMWKPAVKSSID